MLSFQLCGFNRHPLKLHVVPAQAGIHAAFPALRP
jgi:hypothetical protein